MFGVHISEFKKLNGIKNAFSTSELALSHELRHAAPFLNKSSLSVCQNQVSKKQYMMLLAVLAFFGAFEMTAHVKKRLTLLGR